MKSSQPKTEHELEAEQTPNVEDPLSEPVLHRRVWACYLHRGYTRASFARAMKTTWSVVQTWDHGKRGQMSLKKLIDASRILNYSLDELCHGKQALVGREPVLDRKGIMEALSEAGASSEARAAFGRHMTSPEGQYQEITRAYVHGWVTCYMQLGSEPEALKRAVNARALSNAVASTAPNVLDLTKEDINPHELAETLRQLIAKLGPGTRAPARKSARRR